MPDPERAAPAQVTTYTHPQLVVDVCAPRGWEEDTSGADKGLFIYLSSDTWNEKFRPNIVLVQRDAETGTESLEQLAASQDTVEDAYSHALDEYRLVHLDADTVGLQGLPGLLRIASYKNPDGIPLMMFQWIAVHNGAHVDLTITYPTEMLGANAQLILNMGHGLLWKEATS